ncbi:hypothetical protein BJX70DRAFT_404031 [Aspergillus crustosus]
MFEHPALDNQSQTSKRAGTIRTVKPLSGPESNETMTAPQNRNILTWNDSIVTSQGSNTTTIASMDDKLFNVFRIQKLKAGYYSN